jgi:14-3-3 protein beta/theta/zeta
MKKEITLKSSLIEAKLSKDALIFLIKTCFDLEMFEECYSYTKTLLEVCKFILNEDERNIFMKSFKAKLNILREGWKILLDYDQPNVLNLHIEKEYINSEIELYEKKIKEFCVNTVMVIESLLQNLSQNNNIPSMIFYIKLKGDYMRYYAEVSNDEEFQSAVESAQSYYHEANDKCKQFLEPNDPLYLSVALNYSVFIYEIIDNIKKACEIADQAYKQAIIKLNTDQKVPEIEFLIKSIEENLLIWNKEKEDYH